MKQISIISAMVFLSACGISNTKKEKAQDNAPEISRIKLESSAPYPSPENNFKIDIAKEVTSVEYFVFPASDSMITSQNAITNKDLWKNLQEMSTTLQDPNVFKAGNGAVGFKTIKLELEFEDGRNNYNLVWTSMNEDKITQNTQAFVSKVKSGVISFEDLNRKD